MFRNSTWAALLVLAVLVGVLVYMNREQQAVEEAAQSFPTLPSRTVIPEGAGALTRIRLEPASGTTVEVMLDLQGNWQVILPFLGRANQGNVEAAVTEIGSMRYLNEIKDVPLADLGLDPPVHVLTLDFKNGAQHILWLGDKTPSETGYYARLDGERILVIEDFAIESLLMLVASPPYYETPTPSPLPPDDSVTPAP
jgi:hypothetical protein